MKKNFVLFAVLLSFLFTSCGFEIPEKVSVKTKAKIALSIGTFNQKLSEYFSVNTINDVIKDAGSENDSISAMSVYDYWPEKSSSVQQYMIEVPIKEIPIDIGDYFQKMDITTGLIDQNFALDISTKGFSKIANACTVDFPNMNDMFIEKARVTNIKFAFGEASSNLNIDTSKINFTSPAFEYVTVQKGSLLLVLGPKSFYQSPDYPDFRVSGHYSEGFKTDFVFILSDAKGVEIARSAPADIPSLGDDTPIVFDISGKNLPKTVRVRVEGTTTGGNPLSGNGAGYDAYAGLSSDSVISKVVGLTMTKEDLRSDGIVPVDKDVDLALGSGAVGFEYAKIANGSFKAVSKMPDGWSGVTTTADVALSGGITDTSDSEFTKDEGSSYILNRSLNLAGKTISKSPVKIKGNIQFDFNNATLNLKDNSKPKIPVVITGTIEKIEELAVDVSGKSFEGFEYDAKIKDAFPSEVGNYISEIQLAATTIKGTYTNTLPAGNDITLNTNSVFFGMNNVKTVMNANTEEGSFVIKGTENPTVNPGSDKCMDLKTGISLPGADGDIAVFKNLETEKDYKIGMSVLPVVDWKQVTISKFEGLEGLKDSVKTGFSFNSLFGGEDGLTSFLGNEFIDKIKFNHLYVYFYCIKPELDLLNGIKFSGNIDLSFCNKETGEKTVEKLLGSNAGEKQDLLFSTYKKLETEKLNDVDVIVSRIEEKDASLYSDIAGLIDGRDFENPEKKDNRDSELVIDYDLSLAGSNGITIKKEDFEAKKAEKEENGEQMAGSIQIKCRLVIPLDFSTAGADLDFVKMIDSKDKDLFGRDEPTDMGDFDEYLDAIKSMTIMYDIDNSVFNYNNDYDKENCKLVLNTKVDAMSDLDCKNNKYEIKMTKGELKIETADARKWLKYHPFKPDINIHLPNGNIIVPRDAGFGACLGVKIEVDENCPIKIFGD